MVNTVNTVLAVLVVLGQGTVLLLLLSLIFGRRDHPNLPVRLFGRNALLLGFLIALVSMLGSLFYSEIAGYEPCELCWFQRIVMYPQALLFLIALIQKDLGVTKYVLWMSLIGAVVAGYHALIQFGATPLLPCSAVVGIASCSQRFVLEFGSITIPMMAFTGFLLIFSIVLSMRRYARAHIFSRPESL